MTASDLDNQTGPQTGTQNRRISYDYEDPLACGLGEVKLSGQILPTMKRVVYGIDIKRVMRGKLVLGIADGWLSADGAVIYRALDIKVGLFRQDAVPQPSGA